MFGEDNKKKGYYSRLSAVTFFFIYGILKIDVRYEMTYEETLEWIHDHLVFGIKPGLKRMLWVLGQLGNPQKKCQGSAYRWN